MAGNRDHDYANGLRFGEAGTSLRIMCVGDSITAGYTDNPKWTVPFEFGYRRSLLERLMKAGYSVQYVGDSPEPWNGAFGIPGNTPTPDLRAIGQDHHRGYGGWGTGAILSKIDQWVADDNPDIVLLMVGINDGGSPAAYSNLAAIVEGIVNAKPNVHVIVAQITPKSTFMQSIVDFNLQIRETLVPFYQARGKRVSTVDQYANFVKEGLIDPGLFANGINHPNAAAYDGMAQTWFLGIQQVLTSRALGR